MKMKTVMKRDDLVTWPLCAPHNHLQNSGTFKQQAFYSYQEEDEEDTLFRFWLTLMNSMSFLNIIALGFLQ